MPTLCEIEQKLLLPKAHYFLFFGGTAAIMPFLPTLIMQQLRISELKMSVIYTILPFMMLLSKPFIGGLADKLQKQKAFLIISIASALLSLYAIKFIPGSPDSHYGSAGIECGQNHTQLSTSCYFKKDSKTNETAQCEIKCNLSTSDDCSLFGQHCDGNTTYHNNFKLGVKVLIKNENGFYKVQELTKQGVVNTDLQCLNTITFQCSYFNCTVDDKLACPVPATDLGFYILACLMMIGWCSMSVVSVLADAMTLGVLTDRKYLFGRQRLFATLGWGATSMLTGQLIQIYTDPYGLIDFSPSFYILLITLSLNFCVAFKFPKVEAIKSERIVMDVWKKFARIDVIVFSIAAFFCGFFSGPMWTLFFAYLNELSNNDQLLIGWVVGVQSFAGELPLFFISGWILKKIGYANAISLVFLTFVIRFTGYSFVENAWWVLPFEVCSGGTYAIFYSALATYASVVAPKGAESTMQGILQAIFEGFGVGVGTITSGFIYDAYGGRVMFQVLAVTAGTLFVLHVIVQLIMTKCCGITPEKLSRRSDDVSNGDLNGASNHGIGLEDKAMNGKGESLLQHKHEKVPRF